MTSFATVDDAIRLWRNLTPEEMERAEALLEVISDVLREEANRLGEDLDVIAKERASYKTLLKSVTVDVLARTLMTSTDSEPMTQFSESALGYSYSGTFLTPGGGLFIKRDELARLGLKAQKVGGMELYGTQNKGHYGFLVDPETDWI